MKKLEEPHTMASGNHAHRSFSPLRWTAAAGIVAAVGIAMCTTGLQANAAVAATWHAQMPPNPSGATAASLSGVSCPAANECVAVGSASFPGGTRTLAERWNGTTWSILSTPNPAPAGDSLTAVSCPSVSVCVAVGSTGSNSDGTQYGLIERWNGSSWSATKINPGEGGSAVFVAVSCVSASACTAVGNTYNCCDPEQFTMAERWNGTSWSLQSTPEPDCGCSQFTGVSCPNASVCTASSEGPLAERWTGGSWIIGTSQPPAPGSGVGGLEGVSCPSATTCTAVGYYYTNMSYTTRAALSDYWNGSSWAIQTQPSSAEELRSVSCPTTSACSAIGVTHASGVFASHWNGSNWVAQTVPAPGTHDTLNAIDCTSATACIAVGTYRSGSEMVTLAERYS